MNRKRFLNTLFASVVAISMLITGCTQKNSKPPEVSATPGENAAEENTAAAAKEPITFSIWPVMFANNIPSGIQEDPVAKDIEAKLGIKMNIDTHPTDEKWKALMASGDLPDIILAPATDMVTLIKSGQVIPLDELVDKYGGDIKQNASEMLKYSQKYLSNNTGDTYFLSSGVEPVNPAITQTPWGLLVGPYLRWDYYKELNYPEIKNFDDYINVVADMLQKHPTNEEGKKNFGFSPWFDAQGVLFQTNTFTGYVLGKEGSGGALVLESNRDGSDVRNMYTTEDSIMWQGVEFWYKVKQKGLMDPDAFTQKNENAQQKANTNQVLASVFSWPLAPTNGYLKGLGHDGKGFTPVPIPMIDAKYAYSIPTPTGLNGRSWAITKNAKNPERAMELINYFFSINGAMTIYNGVEGTDWVLENGKAVLTEKFRQNNGDPDAAVKYGYNKYQNDVGLGPNFINPATNQKLNLLNEKEEEKLALASKNAVEADFVQYYGKEVASEVLPKNRVSGDAFSTSMTGFINSFMPIEVPTDIKRQEGALTAYIEKQLLKVMLAKDDNEFKALKQQTIDQAKKMGVEALYDYYSGEFAKALVQAKEIIKF
ncbi:extracellular solute-binding protein [Cohnella silvisoli]|uniref:Extracellular solute-binding protein n=1 Tax=Cohnella silvisoli TaxID=2873699 RepID=A0ABV1KSZ9_9BACL|nr:extracellular solute-binding protein [Cohnella silvisoli]MCD9021492.1 extracellular solute-binding protein [Cohnella silvisoli]